MIVVGGWERVDWIKDGDSWFLVDHQVCGSVYMCIAYERVS